jgi:hypothetical protein
LQQVATTSFMQCHDYFQRALRQRRSASTCPLIVGIVLIDEIGQHLSCM